MKLLALLAVTALGTGCTATTTTTASRRPDDRFVNKRVHTQEQLQQTGQPEIGAALQTVDPSVYISGR
ncbi:MAG: hypothetical protein H0U88_06805 [Chthoniobacterales bacterium]|nr:hypothetical protein [Chthoniobacterales bacterium]MDQ3120788.1 hypothetical protein [Verrucomicrobiota bacterium]